jgi:hypothetical protein
VNAVAGVVMEVAEVQKGGFAEGVIRHIWYGDLSYGQTVWGVAHQVAESQWLRGTATETKRIFATEAKRKLGESAYSEIEEPGSYIYGRNYEDGSRFYIDISGSTLKLRKAFGLSAACWYALL